jgi:hypothetical protein
VRTGLRGDERAWSRGLTGRWAGGGQATRNEWRLYAALLRHQSRQGTWGSDLALRPLCWATIGETKAPTPLYRIPFATLDAPGRLRNWIVERESNLVAILRAVARIVEAGHATGHAIGAFHTEAFASAISWSPDPLAPTPTVVLAHAPCSARFDEAYNAPPLGSDVLPTHYTMLRTPVLIPAVSLGQRASASSDLDAFAAFVLDLLLEQPLIDRDTIHWFDAGKIAHSRAVACAPKHAELVRWLVDAIEDPAGGRRLGDLVRQLATPGVARLAQLRLAR